jgi:peptide/nickel transport system permease protein
MAISEAGGLNSHSLVRGRRWRLSSVSPTSRYYWLRMLLENPAVLVSLGFIVAVGLLGALAPIIATTEPDFVNPVVRLEGPSTDYWFGTDDLGRDVFSRAIYGARISLLVGVTVMVGATSLGSVIGLLRGTTGGSTRC